MRTYSVEVAETHEVVSDRIQLAANTWLRFRGLMGVRTLAVGEGMLFPHTNMVHGFFMRISIRLLYLNKEGVVLRTAILHPWSIGPWVRNAYWVLELPPETPIAHVGEGVRLTWSKTAARVHCTL